MLKNEDPTRGVVIGYDTRFLSGRAARAVAEVIAGAGIPVLLANDYVPYARCFLQREETGRCWRRHDHVEPQSVELERGEV